MTPKALIICLIAASCLASCTTDTDELRWKLRDKNEKYLDLQERRRMRKEARQERVDAWFDRIMH